MKIRPLSYTFDASAKTITCSSFSTLDGILLITNVTDNVIIYNFADPTKGGSLTSSTLTLVYDTSSMSDSDSLLIYVDDGINTQTVSINNQLSEYPLPESQIITLTPPAQTDSKTGQVVAVDKVIFPTTP